MKQNLMTKHAMTLAIFWGLGLLAACSSDNAKAVGPGGSTSIGGASGVGGSTSVPDTAVDGGDAAQAVGDAATTSDAGPDGPALVNDRPYGFKVPRDYDAAKPTPLVILFHAYGATGAIQDSYFKLGDFADTDTFLFAYPDGTLDSQQKRFWNADDACCDFYKTGIDDIAYARAILDDVSSRYNVDPKRIFIVGHSSGGFMAHRLACELSSRVAGIVSLAGAVWNETTKCQPSAPIAVLEVHGDADQTVLYAGGQLATTMQPYPGARKTVATWAQNNGCSGALIPTGRTLDLDTTLLGAETKVEAASGCTGGAVELWTIQGGEHIPTLQTSWAETIYGFLAAHPKP